ncbi:hypothetical protein CPB86DRAFT_783033 [Serendipita vermifera]|nr:hypothetical protein CPB86DRAFT_783033 [Serendipita vermifera]
MTLDLSQFTDIATEALRVHAVRYMAIVGAVAWFWDILITLDEEVTFWKTDARWLIKALYAINRYLPFLGLSLILHDLNPIRLAPISDQLCKGMFVIIFVCQVVGVIVATSIFVIRICAVSADYPVLRQGLVTLITISHLVLLGFLGILARDVIANMTYVSVIHMCYQSLPWALGGIYATPIFIETVVFLATLYHAIVYNRSRRSIKSTVTSNILNTLYLDGALYYIIIITLRLGTCLTFFLAPISLSLLICYVEYALTSALTSRWFLSFRRTLADAREISVAMVNRTPAHCSSSFYSPAVAETDIEGNFTGISGTRASRQRKVKSMSHLVIPMHTRSPLSSQVVRPQTSKGGI